jgi:hypothetical protein
MEILSVNFIHLLDLTMQEQLEKMQLYIGHLAGIEPVECAASKSRG